MKRTWVALLATLVLAGCSSGGSRSSSASTTAPSTSGSSVVGFGVVASAPQDGEQDVRVDLPLFVTFSEDLDPGTLIPGAVELRSDTGPVAASVQAVTARVLQVQPNQPLDAQTKHLLRVTAQVGSLGGARLPQDVLIQFTTGMPRVGVPGGATSGGSTPAQVVAPYVAGAAAEDITPPVGVPLAGFGGGARRHLPLPDLNPFNDYTFLNPSQGIHDPIMAKALVLGNGVDTFCLVTLDAIATDARVVEESWKKAQAQGFSLPLEKVLVCSSHTHSGPGALSKRLFWELVAADLYKDRVFQGMTDGIARAMLAAEQGLGPAVVGTGTTQVTNATENRRAGDSPDLNRDSIDPELTVLRVDRPNGDPVATVWNFPVHGTMFGTHNLDYSADVMGSASIKVEAAIGGVSLFVNGAEGDIRPVGDWDSTGRILADAILAARNAATPRPQGILQSVHEIVDLGHPTIDWSLQRNGGQSARLLNSGIVQGLQHFGLGVGVAFAMPASWVEHEFRFQAVRVGDTVFASFPGEPIHVIGQAVRQDGLSMGFAHVIPACLANGHGSYFTTEKEYYYGGYEALASFFGPKNGQLLEDEAHALMLRVR